MAIIHKTMCILNLIEIFQGHFSLVSISTNSAIRGGQKSLSKHHFMRKEKKVFSTNLLNLQYCVIYSEHPD